MSTLHLDQRSLISITLLIYSTKWVESCTILLLCRLDHKYNSNPDLSAIYTIRKLALCRDDNSNFRLTSIETSQIIEIVKCF